MGLLRKDLSAQGDFQKSSSVATVALLLMIESLSGSTTTADAHRFGLLELLKCYSPNKTPLHLMVSDVLMSDIKSATSSLSKPSFGLSDEWVSGFERLKYLPFGAHRPDLAALGSGFLATNVGPNLGSAFLLLLCAMRNLINDVERIVDLKLLVPDGNGSHFLVLEHQLLSLQSGKNQNRLVSTLLAEACRIGAILYCNLCMWTWPKSATLIKNLLSHLRAAISRWKLEACAFEHCQTLLWLHFIGDFACSTIGERQWYLEGMTDLLEPLNISREDHFRSVLAKFFYVDRLMGTYLKDCYSKISRNTTHENFLLSRAH